MIVGVVVGVIVLISVVVSIRILRRRHPNPRYIPTPFLKRLWSDWRVPAKRSGPRYELSPDDDADWSTRYGSHTPRPSESISDSRPVRQSGVNQSGDRRASAAQADGGVDRNTSVRSVLTLPAYRIQPADSEQVLGREGERDGVDIVVELPTEETEEAMREEEMDALYQIRLARRRQIAEREERRQRRREARERNDVAALSALRQERQAATNSDEVEELRREHSRLKATRQRAVSSVSYHDVGIARADGTRIRANSTESERIGLLSDAASIAASANSTGPGSLFHRRDRSASSALSIDTAHSSDGRSSPGLTTADSRYSMQSQTRSRANSGANTPRVSGAATSRAGSSPEVIDAEEADLGSGDMPPPGYDDVSLVDDNSTGNNISGAGTPVHSRSGANSPYNEPPPDYPGGPTQTRNNRLSAHMADLAAEAGVAGDEERGHERRASRGVGGIPQLPSLRLNRLPQIVIEPSSARPGSDDGR